MLRFALAAMLFPAAVARAVPTAKTYPEPSATTWTPTGCSGVPWTSAVLPGRDGWTNLHGDIGNSDAVTHIVAPVMTPSWTAEAATYNPTGPVFDASGNLYLSPMLPYENVVLISMDPATGARRWAIPGTGAIPGGAAPMVLHDPIGGGEIVYLALYDRVVAVRTDGVVVWDVPSGLTVTGAGIEEIVLGTNYLPSHDAIVGLTKDGFVFAVDRVTGAQILNAPFQLPGLETPPVPSTVPAPVFAAAEDLLQGFVNAADGVLRDLIDTLLGNGTEVANMFSVDPWTGRLWVAATAADAEDGTVDGVSEFGALFRLELILNGSGYDVVEICHRSFAGGSASTPTLTADGSRIYLGDNFGKLLAVQSNCTDAWELDLGTQINGSVSVPSERGEIFASSRDFVAKVVDDGPSGHLVWTATIDPFENLTGSEVNFNLNLITTASNGLAFQAGAGVIFNGTPLPVATGIGVLDRETGAVRSFAAGGDETVAVMSVGPDGALYVGNSPLRRLFAKALGLGPAPLVGGVTKWESARHDLLIRDAACAGAARADNARDSSATCPDAAEADRLQLLAQVQQAAAVLPLAEATGQLPTQWIPRFAKRLARTEALLLAAADPRFLRRGLGGARSRLRRICRRIDGAS